MKITLNIESYRLAVPILIAVAGTIELLMGEEKANQVTVGLASVHLDGYDEPVIAVTLAPIGATMDEPVEAEILCLIMNQELAEGLVSLETVFDPQDEAEIEETQEQVCALSEYIHGAIATVQQADVLIATGGLKDAISRMFNEAIDLDSLPPIEPDKKKYLN